MASAGCFVQQSRPQGRAQTREDQHPPPRQRLQLAQQLHRLPRQGDQVIRSRGLALQVALHPVPRNGPHAPVKVQLCPLGG